MQHDVMPSIVQVDPDVLKTLLKEVKETVANYIQLPAEKQKEFGVVDMWKIRRTAKSASARVRR
ncbi:hypothetical protein LZZ85_04795 [Terrimonas sp. NA20]|uniref:Uncharacterized protein n=1 Tax=Terrimonas ginsenosidimutans TaxID=2908004 RepID=A0ABS9KMP8_9BACT|nr:hypothetical protein [Terrimonas ginsenosidimutans]MCG2613583.1 hypothetical protein [Terrimonas ginsenosidimutans]